MKFNSPYLPSEGKYRPEPVKDATSYGYPWQHNPLLHKVTSEHSRCRNRNVFRIYQDNLIFYTRTNQQVADGLHSYYLYDDQGRITETGEVTLPIQFTDDDWYRYPYKSCELQTAFIRSLGSRTNVMVAAYNATRTTVAGECLCFYPIKNIRNYALIEADNPMDGQGYYLTQNDCTQHNFDFNDKEDVNITVFIAYPAIAAPQPYLEAAAVTLTTNIVIPLREIIQQDNVAPSLDTVLSHQTVQHNTGIGKQNTSGIFLSSGFNRVATPSKLVRVPASCYHEVLYPVITPLLINSGIKSQSNCILQPVSSPASPGTLSFLHYFHPVWRVAAVRNLPAFSARVSVAANAHTRPRPPTLGSAEIRYAANSP